MKKRLPIWEKLLLTAAAAFFVGFLPYLLLRIEGPLISFHDGGFIISEQARSALTLAWAFLSRYGLYLVMIYVIVIAVLIFLEGQNPDRTILWLLTLTFLPVFGLALYMLLGPDMKQIKHRKLFRPVASYPYVSNMFIHKSPSEVRKLSILAYRNSAAEVLERGTIRPLINGVETFSFIKSALRNAKRYINIEYFIIQNDELGQEIAGILCERSLAGVKVRMMTDGVGSGKLGRKFFKRLREAGVDAHTFMPVSFPLLHSNINFRNHRKIIVVDGDVAFTGGLNIGNEYLGKGRLGFWRDTHAMFKGDMVREMNKIFVADWNFCAGDTLTPDVEEFAPTDPRARDELPILPSQLVASGTNTTWHAIQQLFFGMITDARWRVWITTPYLVPGHSIFKALQVAALSGVDVRLLIPSKSDHFLVYWAGRSYVEELLRSGVRVWRYTKGFVHAKTLLMDDTTASIGTANLDARSLEINFEVQAFIYDKKVNAKFASQFLRDIKDAEECELSAWEKRGLGVKALESLGKLWSSQV